jgi:hypothetical protein
MTTFPFKCLIMTFQVPVNGSATVGPPRVNHLDVVGRLAPINEWKPRIHSPAHS